MDIFKPEADATVTYTAAALMMDVSLALIRSADLAEMLHLCTEALVRHLDGAFARIWLANAEQDMLELRASSGLYTHLDGGHSRIPVGKYKIGWIAQARQPHLSNSVQNDVRVSDQTWAIREGMVAFAGYPLVVDDRLVGVVALFARQRLTDAALAGMASVSNAIAVGIERKLSDEALVKKTREVETLRRIGLEAAQAELQQRRASEEALRERQTEIEGLNARLKRAMVETHHRVKNNLQLVAALLEMQEPNEEEMLPVAEVLRLKQHIQALGIIHDILTEAAKEDEDANAVSVRNVLGRVVPILQMGLGNRRLVAQIDEVSVTSKQATSVAIVVNELVANASKHGKGDVELVLRLLDSKLHLEVCDDGPGFAAGFDPQQAASTGLELIQNIARYDLRGETAYLNRPEGGACVVITFPTES